MVTLEQNGIGAQKKKQWLARQKKVAREKTVAFARQKNKWRSKQNSVRCTTKVALEKHSGRRAKTNCSARTN